MQTVLKNPLASPFTIGVSHGAAFGASFAIIFLGAGLLLASSFAGALLAVGFILLLASLKGVSTEAVILSGVALSSFFGAVTMLLQYVASDVQVAASVFWTFGDLGKVDWTKNLLMGVSLAAVFAFFFDRWNHNALLWGEK